MTEERKAMEDAQDALEAFKKSIRKIRKINTEAGRLEAANAAYLIEGMAVTLHATATKELHAYWPDHASEIQARGPGR